MTICSSGEKLARLAQDFVGDCHFADVVQKGTAGDDLDVRRADAHGASQGDGVSGYTLGVAFRSKVFRSNASPSASSVTS